MKSISARIRLVFALIGGFVCVWLFFLLTPSVTQEGGVVYYLHPGTSKQTLINELTQQDIIHHPVLFSLYVYPHQSSQLKTGEYLFPKGATLVSIWRQIATGTGLYYRAFKIIPGWNFSQLRHELNVTSYLRHSTQLLDEKQIMTLLGNPQLAPEGEFFPETYYYTRGISDLVILKQAFSLMQLHLNQAWETRSHDLPYKNAYDALIAASLIEKEAYLNTERPIIAGVLINRLNKDMLLQFDPTVIYGMGQRYTGKIHKENLLEDTVYNTYVHKGLPPTPIAMPSLASIVAATHPEMNDYYYFVAKGDGSHQFSNTLSEHNAAVKASIRNSAL